jgi:hypothetical protein
LQAVFNFADGSDVFCTGKKYGPPAGDGHCLAGILFKSDLINIFWNEDNLPARY